MFNEIQFVFPLLFDFIQQPNPKTQRVFCYFLFIFGNLEEDEEGWKGICVKCECTREIKKTGTTKTANFNNNFLRHHNLLPFLLRVF